MANTTRTVSFTSSELSSGVGRVVWSVSSAAARSRSDLRLPVEFGSGVYVRGCSLYKTTSSSSFTSSMYFAGATPPRALLPEIEVTAQVRSTSCSFTLREGGGSFEALLVLQSGDLDTLVDQATTLGRRWGVTLTFVLPGTALPAHVGATDVTKAYVGSTEITKMYLGSSELG